MSDDPQAAERHRHGIPAGLDPRTYDPRRAMEPAVVDRLVRAQARARAQAQATTTVMVATIVSLVTSAFSFVAALAWNDAIHEFLTTVVSAKTIFGVKLVQWQSDTVYAVLATIIAVLAVLLVNRIAGRIATRSAINAAEAGQGSL